MAGAQADHTAFVFQATGLQSTAVFNHAAEQLVGRLRRQNDQSARRLHSVAVFNEGSHGGGGDHDVGQAVLLVKLQLEAFASGQGHGAHLGNHDAVVAHLWRQQGNVAAQAGRQGAIVDDLTRGAVAVELHGPGHEVRVADAVRGGRKAPHIHAGAWRKVDAAGVGQNDMPIGIDLPKNLARRAAQHPVQQHAAGRWLNDVDLSVSADVKALPVQGCALAGLGDGHG